MSNCDGNRVAIKPEIFTILPFAEKFADPYFRIIFGGELEVRGVLDT